jgi:peptidoglycan/xylan/chitin deacetylase (PgdA/CDA1 family)
MFMHRQSPLIRNLLLTLSAVILLSDCAAPRGVKDPAAPRAATPYPIRFLLTFDDGPSIRSDFNPTESILKDLADNPVQPGIKAIFFVQTRAHNGGGTPRGRELILREQNEGHLLGFHTATSRHWNHRKLPVAEFEQSVKDGINDAVEIAGKAPKLVRPPFWSYDYRTFTTYQSHGLQMLLTNLSANDGKIYGGQASPRRRINLYNQLSDLSEKIRAGLLPVVNGEIPVIVTFHDINSYTARHMHEYLQILMETAQELELPTAAKPFYDDREQLEQAALACTVTQVGIDEKHVSLWERLTE